MDFLNWQEWLTDAGEITHRERDHQCRSQPAAVDPYDGWRLQGGRGQFHTGNPEPPPGNFEGSIGLLTVVGLEQCYNLAR